MHVFEGLNFFTICLKKLFFYFKFLFTIVQFNVICRFRHEVWSNLDRGGGGGLSGHCFVTTMLSNAEPHTPIRYPLSSFTYKENKQKILTSTFSQNYTVSRLSDLHA